MVCWTTSSCDAHDSTSALGRVPRMEEEATAATTGLKFTSAKKCHHNTRTPLSTLHKSKQIIPLVSTSFSLSFFFFSISQSCSLVLCSVSKSLVLVLSLYSTELIPLYPPCHHHHPCWVGNIKLKTIVAMPKNTILSRLSITRKMNPCLHTMWTIILINIAPKLHVRFQMIFMAVVTLSALHSTPCLTSNHSYIRLSLSLLMYILIITPFLFALSNPFIMDVSRIKWIPKTQRVVGPLVLQKDHPLLRYDCGLCRFK